MQLCCEKLQGSIQFAVQVEVEVLYGAHNSMRAVHMQQEIVCLSTL